MKSDISVFASVLSWTKEYITYILSLQVQWFLYIFVVYPHFPFPLRLLRHNLHLKIIFVCCANSGNWYDSIQNILHNERLKTFVRYYIRLCSTLLYLWVVRNIQPDWIFFFALIYSPPLSTILYEKINLFCSGSSFFFSISLL